MIKKILRENIIYIVLIVVFVLFCLIAKFTIIGTKILSIDYEVIKYILNMRDERLTEVLKFITNFGDWYVPVTITSLFLIFIKNKRVSAVISASYLFAFGINQMIKLIVCRARPINYIIELPIGYSFPSAHTMLSLCFFGVFCYIMVRKSNIINKIVYPVFFSFIIFLIGFSRVYLGVHYFSDVIGAIILGTIVLLMSLNIISKNFKECLE